ncbi:MAG: hemerythrin domain-containing protein [Solirubrobacteraceae bacterium]
MTSSAARRPQCANETQRRPRPTLARPPPRPRRSPAPQPRHRDDRRRRTRRLPDLLGSGRTRPFPLEEDVLLPAFARHHPPTDDAIVRVLTDHVDLRRRAADLATNPSPKPEDLHALGGRLHAHIRHEERILFPLIEAAMPENELIELAAAVENANQQRA